MKNLPILAKFLSILALFGVFVIGACIYATSGMRQIDARYTSMLKHQDAVALNVARASNRAESVHAAIGDLVVATNDANNRAFLQVIGAASRDFDAMIDQAAADAEPGVLPELQAIKAQFHHVADDICAPAIAQGQSATTPPAVLASQAAFSNGCAAQFEPLRVRMIKVVSDLKASAKRENAALSASTNAQVTITYAVILIGLALVAAAGFFVIRAFVTGPLGEMNRAMERLAGGDNSVAIAGTDRKDEIGSMAMALQVFKEAAIAKVERDRVEAQRNIEIEGKFDAISRVQAIIEFAPDGTVLDANDNFLRALGYSLAEIKGQHHRMFVPSQDASGPSYQEFWSRLRSGQPVISEFCRVGKGGREVWISASYNPIPGADGKVVKVIKYATDVTPRVIAVNKVGDGLTHLAAGDLTFEIREALLPAFEQMRTDFNDAIGKMRDALGQVNANASAIHSGSSEIATAADDLSRRTEQQAASLEETAAALDQITATVRKTAEGAIHAREVVGAAKGDAEKSGEVVREAVSAMSVIEKSSNQVSQIIGVIDEIAFQTNLLALNAGVEAARAGDAGRGFAVVASEVRALAQRSAEAAKEIKSLILASSQQVASGVTLVGEAGRALDRIAIQVTEINGVVGEIAASAQEQSTALHEVNTAVNQMDQVTQQNAAMVEQTTAASHSLAHEAEELSLMISRFKLGGELSAAEPRQRKGMAPRAAQAPRTAMKTLGAGGAARKAQAATDQDWEEF